MIIAISDDGSHVAVAGRNTPFNVYQIDGSCVKAIDTSSPISKEGYQECPNVSLDEVVGHGKYLNGLEFGDSNYELKAYTTYGENHLCDEVHFEDWCEGWQTIRAAGYNVPAEISLDYLALGDSYSSGEGDTERSSNGAKYYKTGTDIKGSDTKPEEKCHVSTRSYPYILVKGMNLTSGAQRQWGTIACSGAETKDVSQVESWWMKSSADYTGQNNRLEGFNVNDLKAKALNEFIPGRHHQIEFVKKYKPKVITLTMGGNDIGFADKVEQCIAGADTCRIATADGKASLASQIRNKYARLVSLYKELYEASGRQAKIYVLSYPQFVNNDKDASCGLNVGLLDADERETIYQGTTYLNSVIKQAAKAAGVKYVDIEDSLDGHRLCDDGEKYITGVVGWPVGIKNDKNESYHPNAKGHFEMAMTIWDRVNSESLLDYDFCGEGRNNCPDTAATEERIDVPEYFESISEKRSIYRRFMDFVTSKKGPTRIHTGSNVFMPHGSASIKMYSEPTDLGSYIVTESGSLDEYVIIPDSVPAGHHTVVISGETYSGEQIELEQVVLVLGPDPEDVDENSVPDSEQPCGPFVIVSGVDEDGDGIDDACDPMISADYKPDEEGEDSTSHTGTLHRGEVGWIGQVEDLDSTKGNVYISETRHAIASSLDDKSSADDIVELDRSEQIYRDYGDKDNYNKDNGMQKPELWKAVAIVIGAGLIIGLLILRNRLINRRKGESG